MRRKLFRNRMTARLMLANGVLAALLLLNLAWQVDPRLPEVNIDGEAASTEEITLALPQRAAGQLADFGVTLQRPLFIATRRPAPVAVAKPGAPAKPKAPPRSNLNQVRLTGVVMMPERAFGLLSVPGRNDLMRVQVGAAVKGWKVVHIAEDGMVLNNGEEDTRLDLWPESRSVNRAQAGTSDNRPRTITPVAGGRPK